MSWLPDGARTRMAAWGIDRAWPFLALAVVALVALAIALGPTTLNEPSSREIRDVALPNAALEGQLAVQDTDNDGLADALENYVYGTDPEAWDSSGTGIPDGYYAHFGYHPLEPDVANRTIAEPPSSALPAGYEGEWPDRYRLSVRTFYELTRPVGYVPGEGDVWWKAAGQPSPAEWDKNGDSISDAWFVVAQLDPFNTALDRIAPGSSDTMTVRENWQLGTNPSLVDTDGDGIADADEPAMGLNPLAFSTLQAGVADGWLLELGLDPLDPGVLFVDPDRDGLTTAEEFRESARLLSSATVQEIAANGLDPFHWDTSGDGIPDGWLVVNGLDPLDPSVGDGITERASDYGPIRFLDDAPGELEPLGDLELTVRDEYNAAKPESWSEARDGVWWGGTSPATNDTDEDGLPDVIEVRGWYIGVTLDKGPGARAQHVLVHADPARADSDGDGIDDLAEYRGSVTCASGETRAFPPTHPGRSDTAFSGLSDLQKVCGFEIAGTAYDLGPPGEGGLDPTKADSDGDLMADGPEARYWHRRSTSVGDPYPFADSAFASTLDMASKLPLYAGAPSQRIARALAPDGDWDGDGLPNILDPDSSSAIELAGEATCGQASEDPLVAFLLDGPQIDPQLYRFTELSSTNPRPATDPANPDTDGDGLSDAWEARFARFLDQQGRWSLDPTKLSSSGAATPDGRANLDGDTISYFAPPDQVKTYAHDNLQECRSGTDPNVLFSDDDGVSDGWKVFWGLRYVNLVAGSDPLVGQPNEAAKSTVLTRASSVSLSPGEPLIGMPPWFAPNFPVPYTRYVPLAEGDGVCETRASAVQSALEDVTLADWEHLPPDLEEEAPCVLTADDTTRLLLPVRGSFNATYSALYGTGANPYLDDADGDGVDDWFEVLMARTPGRGPGALPSPLAADGDNDGDEDGLPLLSEYEAWLAAIAEGNTNGGPDATLADSDHDGLSDADEVLAGFDPKDPFTRQRLEAEGGDADGDGISDLDEIKGWTHAGQGPRFKTSPIDPDADGDGLLDGVVPAAGRKPAFDALGIARITQGTKTTYLGEGLYQSDPTDLDSSDDGVPDGWQAYYNERLGTPSPTTKAANLRVAYEAGRPLWWDEGLHGVWWWGLPPSAPPCGDLDGDELSDTNGEDPFPARADNTYEHGTFTTSDPEQAKAYILSATSRQESRQRAQAWGPEAGDPLPLREHLIDGCPEPDRAPLSLTELTLTPDPPVLGSPVKVEGRISEPGGAPVKDATVVLSTLRPSAQRALGAAFSDSDGRFTIETTFVEEHTLVVPPGSIFLGTVGAEVTWTSKVEDLQLGQRTAGVPNALVVWSYNTTEAGAAVVELERSLHSKAQLAIDAPPAALVGAGVEVNASLVDGLGRPLAGRTVKLLWDATAPTTTRTATTDLAGRATFVLDGAAAVGATTLKAAFDGERFVEPAQASLELPVRRPTNLTLSPGAPSVQAGRALTLTGTLTSAAGAATGALVELVAGSASTNATTIAGGAFEATLEVPTTTPAGTLAVTARFPGSGELADSEAKASVQVLGLTTLVAPGNVTFPQDKGGLLSGQVLDGRGQPMRAMVSLAVEGLAGISGPSNDDGAWTLPLQAGLPRGVFAGNVVVAETAQRAGAERPITITIRSTGALGLDPSPTVLARGSTLELTGRLVDGAQAAVAGEGVVATLLGRSEQSITDADGRFALDVPIPLEAPLGEATLAVAYAGGIDGSIAPVSVNRTLFVKEGTAITLTRDHAPLANPYVSGVLARSAGEPLAGQAISVEVLAVRVPGPDAAAVSPDAPAIATASATTSATGTFNITLPKGLAPEAAVATLRVVFPGTATLATSERPALINLTTPLVWDAALPQLVPMQRAVTVEGTVRDAAGPMVRAGTVTARLDGVPIGSAPVSDGRFSLALAAPKSITPGQHQLVVTLEPAGLHAATPLERTVTVTTLAAIDVRFQRALTAGGPYEAIARATDEAGRPMANLTLVYWLAGAGGETLPATARTNATGHAILAGIAPEDLSEADGAELTVLARGPLLTRDVAVATAAQVAAPGGLSLLPAVLVAALVALIVAALVVVQRRRRQIGEVRGIVEELIHDLEMGNEYQAAVLLAYKRLALHLEQYGFLDRPEYSAREFVTAVERAMPLPHDELHAFVALFEQARYSQFGVGPAERTAAITRLRRIIAAMDALPRGGRPT